MNPDKVRLWVDALRSGKYRQGAGGLSMGVTPELREYCCLGVACEVAIADGVIMDVDRQSSPLFSYYGEYRESGYLPIEVRQWLEVHTGSPLVRIPDGTYESLTRLNDGEAWSFEQIADALEATYLSEEKK